jgi:hypothetical protein
MHVGKLVSRKSNVFCKTCAKKGYTKLETIYTYRQVRSDLKICDG